MYDPVSGLFAHMDAAEHVMRHAEGPVVRLQSAETQPKMGPRRQPDGHTLRRRQSFNQGNDRLGLTVLPGADWAPLRQAPGGRSVEEPSAAAALSVPAVAAASAAAAVTATRAVPANLLLSRAGRLNPSTRAAPQQFSVATSRGEVVDSKSVKSSSAQQSAVSKSAAAKLVYSPRSDSAPRKQAHSEGKLDGEVSSTNSAALQEVARQVPEQAKSTPAVRPVSTKVVQTSAQRVLGRQGKALRSDTVRAKLAVSQSRQRRTSGPVRGLHGSTDSDSD